MSYFILYSFSLKRDWKWEKNGKERKIKERKEKRKRKDEKRKAG